MQALSNQSVKHPPELTRLEPRRSQAVFYLILIAAMTTAAYWPILGDFYHGDDYIHLTWLPKAVAQPELIWRNFHSTWLDGFSAQFYRPLISVFNVFDYVLWRGNGIGFHVTNLVCHLASVLFLFLIVKEIGRVSLLSDAKTDERPSDQQETPDSRFLVSNVFPLASAALFALYPAHPEAVAWITGRVDGICTMFTLAALWSFLHWRRKKSKRWLIVSLVAFTCGLLSKEMAIPLPAVLAVFAVLFPSATIMDRGSAATIDYSRNYLLHMRGLISASLSALRGTAPFWVILIAYFFVRHYALGTFVGGYDNAGFFIPDWTVFFYRWGSGLANFLVPINQDVIHPGSYLVAAWKILLCLALLSTICFSFKSKIIGRISVVSTTWMILSLAPVMKCFTLRTDLEGARMLYMASAPFCLLIALGLARLASSNSVRQLVSLAGLSGLLLLSEYFLSVNIKPWYEAGRETQAIEASLRRLYKDSNCQKLCYFAGIPNTLHGAYVGCNAFDGMSKVPRMDRNLENCFAFSPIDRIFPYGFAKDKLPEMSACTSVYRWDSRAREFELVQFPASLKNIKQCFYAIDRRSFATYQSGDGDRDQKTLMKCELVERNHVPFVEIELPAGGLHCWNADVLQFDVNVSDIEQHDRSRIARLRYQNNLESTFDEEAEEMSSLTPYVGQQKIVFAMRGNVNWWLGGDCKRIRLEFPLKCKVQVISLQTLDQNQLIPKLEFVEKSRMYNLGPIVLTSACRSCPLAFDVTQIPGAVSAVIDITRPNMFLDSHNSPYPSSQIGKQIPVQSERGKFSIRLDDFSTPGTYELTIRALDRHGGYVGLASDHLPIFIPHL
jgi:putative flippase GtrA